MRGDVEVLSDREREALRLLGRGHEAKSIASALGLSIHTVNERLRTARRKLGVSSSREAARLLLAQEIGAAAPNKIGYKEIGVPADEGIQSLVVRSEKAETSRRPIYVATGGIMITILVSILLIGSAGEQGVLSLSDKGRTAQPMTALPLLFVTDDFPPEARTEGAQGRTSFLLAINDGGRVDRCEIERSSGSEALDRATCRVITSRSRFIPAANAAGQPIASTHRGSIDWALR